MSTLGAALIVAALGLQPGYGPTEDRCDLADQNTVYCLDDGRDTLNQLVFADFTEGGTRVVAWRLSEYCGRPEKVNGRWRVLWIERDGTMRRVWCGAVSRTAYPEDWELLDRAVLPQEERRGLSR